MANIQPYINSIATAVYGEEVRGSIIDAITKVNDDNESYIAMKNEVIAAKNHVDQQVTAFDTTVSDAQSSKAELEQAASAANTAKNQLTSATTSANAAKSQLQTATTTANTTKTSLESSASAAVSDVNAAITRANTAKINLDSSNVTATATNQNLTSATAAANAAKSDLATATSTANTTKANLDSAITNANSTKTDVLTTIDAKADQAISEVNQAKNELAMVVGSVPSVTTTTNNELTAKCTRSGIEVMHIKGKTTQQNTQGDRLFNQDGDGAWEPFTGGRPGPNAEYPLPLNSVTFDKVVVMGKNFGVFPNTGLSSTRVSRYSQFCDGTISLTAAGEDAYIGGVEGEGNSYDSAKGKLIPIPEGATNVYANGFNGPFDKIYITFYDRNKRSLGFSNISYQLSIPADAQYLSYRCGVSNSVSGKTYEGKVMLSFSSIEITDWESPYYEEIGLSEPVFLRGVGNTCDEYLGDGKILRRIEKVTTTPTFIDKTASYPGVSDFHIFQLSNYPCKNHLRNNDGQFADMLCNAAQITTINKALGGDADRIAGLCGSSTSGYLYLATNDFATADEINTYFETHEFELVWPLEELHIETVEMPILPSTDSECTAFLINSQAYTGGMYENLPVETDVTWRPCPLSDPIRKVQDNEVALEDTSLTLEDHTKKINMLLNGITNIMGVFQKTGKIYQTVIPKFAQSNATACIKTLDNEGMSASPATDTTAGTDDYLASGELLFQWRNCNYIRESDGFAVPTAFEGEPGYKTSGAVDVGVFFPTFYYSYLEKDDGYYLTVSDTPNDEWQLKPAEPAVRQDGTVMPYFILSKYPSVIASDGKLRSQPGLAVDRFHSYQNMVTKYGAKGEGYRGAGVFRWTMQYIWILIKYAQKSGQNVFAGCTASNYQCPAATQSSEAHDYIVVTSAQAKNINLGDCVIVGYPTSLSNNAANLDRGIASMCSLVNNKQVTSKETLSDGNVAIHIAGASFSTQDRGAIGENNVPAHVYISSMGRFTGETDKVKGRFDGSYISNASGKHGYRVQGVEYADGAYNTASDVVMIKKADYTIDVYKCKPWDTRKTSETDITTLYTKIGTIPKAPDSSGYGDWWCGDSIISGHVLLPYKSGASDSAGTGDRIYHGGNSTGLREYLQGGGLWYGASAGPCRLYCWNSLSGAWWGCASAD